jgi:NAD(P)-dependent dehydrogenase (short-subunit alcohol dehydrogenase family)
MKGLAGKKVLVTGASSGLGRACLLRLLEEKSEVYAVGRNQEALQTLAKERSVHTYLCDLTVDNQIKELLAGIKSDAGSIHGWVLAAGVHGFRPLMMESKERMQASWQVNVLAPLGLVAGAIKDQLICPGGSLVLFSSAAAAHGGPGLVSYASDKGAIESAVRSLALELAGKKIRVNAIAPGVVETPMSEKYLSRMTEAQIQRLKERHPLGFGLPDDVSGPVAWLLSDDARWTTGSVLVVDGGFSVT